MGKGSALDALHTNGGLLLLVVSCRKLDDAPRRNEAGADQTLRFGEFCKFRNGLG